SMARNTKPDFALLRAQAKAPIHPTGQAPVPHQEQSHMLSWDEFDEEETTTAAPATAAAQPASQTAAKLDNEAAGSVEAARAVAADDADALARAKRALDELAGREGLNELEGEAARVRVDEKRMINARADLNQR